jgi:hypothetical protein
MKKLLLFLILVCLVLIAARAGAEEPQTCPDGSYAIEQTEDGGLVCKLEPTGCPYGDSIQLGPDCDKHKPSETVIETVIQPTFVGK